MWRHILHNPFVLWGRFTPAFTDLWGHIIHSFSVFEGTYLAKLRFYFDDLLQFHFVNLFIVCSIFINSFTFSGSFSILDFRAGSWIISIIWNGLKMATSFEFNQFFNIPRLGVIILIEITTLYSKLKIGLCDSTIPG